MFAQASGAADSLHLINHSHFLCALYLVGLGHFLDCEGVMQERVWYCHSAVAWFLVHKSEAERFNTVGSDVLLAYLLQFLQEAQVSGFSTMTKKLAVTKLSIQHSQALNLGELHQAELAAQTIINCAGSVLSLNADLR